MDVAEDMGDATWTLQRLLTREGGSGIRILDARRQRRILGILNNMRHQADRLRHDSLYKELHRATREGLSLVERRLDRPIHNALGPRRTLRVIRHGTRNLEELPEQVVQYPPRGLIVIYSPPGGPASGDIMQTVMGIRPPQGLAEPALTSTHQARGTTLIAFDQTNPNPDRELVHTVSNAIRRALPENVVVDCPTWVHSSNLMPTGLETLSMMSATLLPTNSKATALT